MVKRPAPSPESPHVEGGYLGGVPGVCLKLAATVGTSSASFGVGLPKAQAASAYAERMHAGQCRSDGTPFVLHPREVALLLEAHGAPDHLIAAALLHDLIEKTGVTAEDLQERFGPQITGLVLAVSDDERIPRYSERKAALRRQVAGAGEEALTLFAADKLSKVRELRREAAAGRSGDGAPRLRVRRLNHYRRSLAVLQERVPGSPLVRALHDELNALLRDHGALVAAG